jgi:hypothetical protein
VRRVSGPLAGLLTLLLALSLASCGDDDSPPDTQREAKVVNEEKGRAALLSLKDLGRGYEKRVPDDKGDNEGLDCLSRAARDFDAVDGATEIEVEFRKPGPAGTIGEVSVLSGFSSFADPDRAETTLDELRGAMQDCRSAEYEEGGTSVHFDISVSDDQVLDALDQQVNVTLDGEITSGEAVLPLVIELRYFRIANHGGTLSVSLLNAPDQATEVDRLVDLGAKRFVKVAERAS